MVRLLFLQFLNRPFKSYDFSNRVTLDVKPVSRICKCCYKLPRRTAVATKFLQRQTLSWDFPFNSGKSKQLNLESNALEDMNRAYCNLNKACLLLLLGSEWFYSGPPIHAQFSQAYAKISLRNQLISSVCRQDGLYLGVDRHHA
jgi:hypothetical protein